MPESLEDMEVLEDINKNLQHIYLMLSECLTCLILKVAFRRTMKVSIITPISLMGKMEAEREGLDEGYPVRKDVNQANPSLQGRIARPLSGVEHVCITSSTHPSMMLVRQASDGSGKAEQRPGGEGNTDTRNVWTKLVTIIIPVNYLASSHL